MDAAKALRKLGAIVRAAKEHAARVARKNVAGAGAATETTRLHNLASGVQRSVIARSPERPQRSLRGQMILVAIKLMLTPLIMGSATLASRRWGDAVGGWLVGLPVISGPVSVYLLIERGAEFAAVAAAGSVSGVISQAAFCVGYALGAEAERCRGAPLRNDRLCRRGRGDDRLGAAACRLDRVFRCDALFWPACSCPPPDAAAARIAGGAMGSAGALYLGDGAGLRGDDICRLARAAGQRPLRRAIPSSAAASPPSPTWRGDRRRASRLYAAWPERSLASSPSSP